MLKTIFVAPAVEKNSGRAIRDTSAFVGRVRKMWA